MFPYTIITDATVSTNTKLFVAGIGEIGINTTNVVGTGYKFLVNESIRAKRIVVETGWSDFVFEKNYKLRTLEEVEKFIQLNGHLPEIPCAEEVECNGGDLGELVKLQMQKIYVIELNKKIGKSNKKN